VRCERDNFLADEFVVVHIETKERPTSGAETLVRSNGTAEEVGEKLLFAVKDSPQRLKPRSKQSTYRSAASAAPHKSNLELSFPQPVRLCASQRFSPQSYFPTDY